MFVILKSYIVGTNNSESTINRSFQRSYPGLNGVRPGIAFEF